MARITMPMPCAAYSYSESQVKSRLARCKKKFQSASVDSRGRSAMPKDLAPPAGHDGSSASTAPSLGLPRHRCISSQCGSDRHLCSASAAVSARSYGWSLQHLLESVHSLRRNPRAWQLRRHGRRAARLLAPAWKSVGLDQVSRVKFHAQGPGYPGWPTGGVSLLGSF